MTITLTSLPGRLLYFIFFWCLSCFFFIWNIVFCLLILSGSLCFYDKNQLSLLFLKVVVLCHTQSVVPRKAKSFAHQSQVLEWWSLLWLSYDYCGWGLPSVWLPALAKLNFYASECNAWLVCDALWMGPPSVWMFALTNYYWGGKWVGGEFQSWLPQAFGLLGWKSDICQPFLHHREFPQTLNPHHFLEHSPRLAHLSTCCLCVKSWAFESPIGHWNSSSPRRYTGSGVLGFWAFFSSSLCSSLPPACGLGLEKALYPHQSITDLNFYPSQCGHLFFASFGRSVLQCSCCFQSELY